MDELRPEFPPVGKKSIAPFCTSLNWSADGRGLHSSNFQLNLSRF